MISLETPTVRMDAVSSKQIIRVGHSPDPDDAFMFHALANGKIDTGRYEFQHELVDIETLNRRALAGELELTAVSLHAYAYLTDKYLLCPCGASMGDGYGPMVVARAAAERSTTLRHKTIAVPGTLTTAYLTLRLCLGPRFQARRRAVRSRSSTSSIAGEYDGQPIDAGLIIHEGQLTYGERYLKLVVDLGKWWHDETGLPLPLGANAIRKDLGPRGDPRRQSAAQGEHSVRPGASRRGARLRPAIRPRSGPRQGRPFVGMYVNDWTLDFGPRGREAVRELLARGHASGVIPQLVEPEFVE